MKDLVTKLATGSHIDPITGDEVDGAEQFTGNVVAIINGIITVLGIVAVVVVIIGGIRYMTSAGDAGKVKTAKDTILYGLIGLAIVALSFAIVNFVIVNILGNS